MFSLKFKTQNITITYVSPYYFNFFRLCHKKQLREAELAGEFDASQQSPALSSTDSGVEADKSPSFA